MVITAACAVAAVAVSGPLTMLALYFLGKRGKVSDRRRISVIEFVIVLLIASVVVTPTTLAIGKDLSVSAMLTDKEFYNGYENEPSVHPNPCHAGEKGHDAESGESNCHYSYDTGAQYADEVETGQKCTGQGSNKTCVPDYTTYYADIFAPYATVEYTYSVSDTLGQSYDYPGTYIATDAKSYAGRAIPSYIPRGAPQDWQDAMSHWLAHNSRPTTTMFEYQNPILALRNNKGIDNYDTPPSDDVVKQYVDKGLVPDHTANILTNPIRGRSDGKAQTVADKAAFECTPTSTADKQAWQNKLMQFNSQLGTKLQGDLHLVIVGSCISDLHQYTGVLKAWWQSAHYGDSPLSKNGIIVVLQTTDGKTISGADATTGMPFGNNGMLNSIRTYLPGTLLSPRDVLGDPRTFGNKQYFEGSPAGSLEDIVLDGPYHFLRACMIHCPAGQTGYGSLIAQLDPPTADKVYMVGAVLLIATCLWILVAFTEFLDRWIRRVPDLLERLLNMIIDKIKQPLR